MAPDPAGLTAGRLVAVVVTHDRPAQLKTTVTALLAAPPADLAALLVVDNASEPPAAVTLRDLSDPRLSVLRLASNLGGAGGFEAGMRHAVTQLAPDWLVLMDDDARPEPGALAAFHRLDLTGWDAIAAAVRHPDGTLCEMNRPTLDPFRRPRVLAAALLGRGREAFHLSERDFAIPGQRAVDGASFVGLFLSRAVIGRMGYPDGRLFLYADDAIYTQSLTRSGNRLAFAPGVAFSHDSTTFDARVPRIRPLWKAYFYHRNLILLYRQATGPFFWPVMALFLPVWALRARHYGAERRLFLRLFGRAVRDGLAGRLDPGLDEIAAMIRTAAPHPDPAPPATSRNTP